MSQFRHHHYPPPATACLPAECPLLIVLGVGWLLIEVSLGVQTGPQANNKDLVARLKGSVVAPKPRSPTFLPGQTGCL